MVFVGVELWLCSSSFKEKERGERKKKRNHKWVWLCSSSLWSFRQLTRDFIYMGKHYFLAHIASLLFQLGYIHKNKKNSKRKKERKRSFLAFLFTIINFCSTINVIFFLSLQRNSTTKFFFLWAKGTLQNLTFFLVFPRFPTGSLLF